MIANYSRYVNDEPIQMNRYIDLGQLRYSVRAVELYAPWFNHIYIVTNGERPDWLVEDNGKISVVSHWDIFKRSLSALPVFNSNAIEMNIHRIDNLTEQYIYLNDDTTFTAPVCWSDFYTKQSGTNIFYMKNWGMIHESKVCSDECLAESYGNGVCNNQCNTVQCRYDGGDCHNEHQHAATFANAIQFTQVLLSEAFGRKLRYYIGHTAGLYERTFFSHLERQFFTEMNQTSFHRVRHVADVQSQFLYYHALQAQQPGHFKLVDAALFYHFIPVSDDYHENQKMFDYAEQYPRKQVCINDDLDYASANATINIKLITNFYRKYFPEKSSFEV